MSDHDLQALYDAAYRRIVGQLTVMTGSLAEAEDVVQEAFVKAILHERTLRDVANPEGWIRTVAVNIARSRWRRVKRFTGLMPQLVGDDLHDRLGLSEDRIALVEALQQLPASQRDAIALHHLADLPVAEVAETLGVPVGTVKARLSRGRAALGALLSPAPATQEVPRG